MKKGTRQEESVKSVIMKTARLTDPNSAVAESRFREYEGYDLVLNALKTSTPERVSRTQVVGRNAEA
jgi:hypothetical protein